MVTKNKTGARILAMGLSILVMGSILPVSPVVEAEVNYTVFEEKKDYIVSTSKTESLERRFDVTATVSSNSDELLEENDLTTLELTGSEVQSLNNDLSVEYIEEDIEVAASYSCPMKQSKKSKYYKKNKSSTEWNLRMICADKKGSSKRPEKPVRIAILDSGVDLNTDMNIAETISLVPGEEDMNPLFMDASGHGTSVAGLAAARDNGEGITGVAPDAEIYSIRVLDDENRSPVSRVIEGIYMAISKKADIINMSFGVSTYSHALRQAVQDARNAGILVIAAAGNTGSAAKAGTDSTVQYPAAFDEVLAVGSVDQKGDIADSSATGTEIDLVAPGESVRSTGMFGSEQVASGTSLAAPQAAGAAARIMEKDRNVSPDFVRDLLCASANSYGSPEEYGSGLIDLDYALKQYDTFKKNYEKGTTGENIHNQKPVTVFEDTGCVKGCWATKDHEKIIKDTNKKYLEDLKMGARFPDSQGAYYEAGRIFYEDKWETLYLFRGMNHNPWWHGFYKRCRVKNFPCNYVFAYIFETQLANEMKTKKAVAMPKNSAHATVAKYIKDSIGRIDWKRHYHDTVPTREQKRAFMWGMAMHSLADAFAHSTCYKNGKRITHTRDAADNTNDYQDQRWKHAEKAVNAAIRRYHQGTEKNPLPGTYKEFSAARDATKYRMINIKQYVTEVSNASEGKKYQNVSISKK